MSFEYNPRTENPRRILRRRDRTKCHTDLAHSASLPAPAYAGPGDPAQNRTNFCPKYKAPGACQKSPSGAFLTSCFQNCKINFCIMILQFCRCGG